MSEQYEQERHRMVESHLAARGIRDPQVLEAMGRIPREVFVPEHLHEFSYEDAPLPIEADQTISQPFIVAMMVEALKVKRGDKALEVGSGSGYAAAVLGAVAQEVYGIERHTVLAEMAARRIAELGMDHVHLRQGDGTLGWPEHAPFDAILVSAGGPESPPQPLLEQLAVGGRLVIPVGGTPRLQELVRITRRSQTEYERESLGPVRFVPLIGEAGWEGQEPAVIAGKPHSTSTSLGSLIRESCQAIQNIEDVDLSGLLDRIGDARVVLLGEASHGTSEFYRMRTRITSELITRKGFNVVAAEADWPDAAQVDRYVRHRPAAANRHVAFSRFPTWMWRNHDVAELVEWLRAHNEIVTDPVRQVSFHGLDLYSLHTSIQRVLNYLDETDPDAAMLARRRYGCIFALGDGPGHLWSVGRQPADPKLRR